MNTILHRLLHTICLSALGMGLAGAMPAATYAQEQAAQQEQAEAAPDDPGIFALEAEGEPTLFDSADAAIELICIKEQRDAPHHGASESRPAACGKRGTSWRKRPLHGNP